MSKNLLSPPWGQVNAARVFLQDLAKLQPGLLRRKKILVNAIHDLEVRNQLTVQGVIDYIQSNCQKNLSTKDKEPLTQIKKNSKKKKKQYIQIIYTPMGSGS